MSTEPTDGRPSPDDVDDEQLDEQAERDLQAVGDAPEGEGTFQVADPDLDDAELEDAAAGGLERLIQYVEAMPPYRADASHFAIKLRLYPDLKRSPLIEGLLRRPRTPEEESRETMLAVTVSDKGRTAGGAQRQAVSLNDDPANLRMFNAICEEVTASLKAGETPRAYKLDEELTGPDPKTRKPVTKPVRDWLPGYIKSDFVYALLDSRFRLVDASGRIIDESSAEEQYFALIDLRQFYVLQEIGSVQKKDGTWTRPRHRALYVFDEPDDEQRGRWKKSGFYIEQQVKDRQRSEQRSVRLRIVMSIFDKVADSVYGMVVSDGTADGVRPLNVRDAADRAYIFGTWQKNAMLPVFNNLMGVGGK